MLLTMANFVPAIVHLQNHRPCKMFPLPLHIYFEMFALLVSILCLRSLAKTTLGWFMPFLAFIVIVELTARYFTYELRQPNAWLFSLSVPSEYIFYSLIFSINYRSTAFRKITSGFIICLVLYSIYSAIFITGLKFFDMNVLVIGSLAMIVLCIFYFIELYNQNDSSSIFINSRFWIVTGILLFNAGEFSYNLLSMLVIDEGFDRTLHIFRSINNTLILVLYSFFSIGFLCQKISGTYRRASTFM